MVELRLPGDEEIEDDIPFIFPSSWILSYEHFNHLVEFYASSSSEKALYLSPNLNSFSNHGFENFGKD